MDSHGPREAGGKIAEEITMRVGVKSALTGLFLAGLGGVAPTEATADPSKVPFTFVTVDVPVKGAASTTIVGINNLGDLVGFYNFIPGGAEFGLPAAFLGKAFVWTRNGRFKNGRFSTIDGPGPVRPELCQPPQSFANCYYIEARGINDFGDVVGTYSQDVLGQPGGNLRAFVQKAYGPFTSYLFPGHTNT
ncbi:MAG: hypothetical protein EXQ52_17235, partial [Bryobacterales bacterium]|nr:hypothetical protein [Bryobacterales bacterium]